jgi:hypothetical protein
MMFMRIDAWVKSVIWNVWLPAEVGILIMQSMFEKMTCWLVYYFIKKACVKGIVLEKQRYIGLSM